MKRIASDPVFNVHQVSLQYPNLYHTISYPAAILVLSSTRKRVQQPKVHCAGSVSSVVVRLSPAGFGPLAIRAYDLAW
jgi:hypothetical protein